MLRSFLKLPTIVIGILLLLPLAGAAGGSAAGQTAVRLELTEADIRAVVLKEEAAWVKLTPRAAAKLLQLTTENLGRQLVVTFDTLPVVQSRIFAAVDSGVLQVDAPSPELRSRLRRIAQLRASKERGRDSSGHR